MKDMERKGVVVGKGQLHFWCNNGNSNDGGKRTAASAAAAAAMGISCDETTLTKADPSLLI